MPELSSEFDIREKTTGLYTATIVGDDHVTPVPLVSLVSITLTLYAIIADGTASFINSRNHQDVLNLHNVTIHATSGLLTWAIQSQDTTLVEPALPFERHIVLFEWVTTSGAAGKHEIILVVKNLGQAV